MYSKTVVIKNKMGLHARPASDFVKMAKQYKSNITIKRTDMDEKAAAKSIVMVLSLACSVGTEVELSAQGDDEQAAVEGLVELIESGLSE
ncbi:MAG: HPr family phosphocarrier protein [Oscillospiraceae bacterium]|nr:HPr family phosphocarrier protein [Oscillospiraceae bacterium]